MEKDLCMIQKRERMIKMLTYRKWDFMIVWFSLTLKTLAALNFYYYFNSVHKLQYCIRNLLLDILLQVIQIYNAIYTNIHKVIFIFYEGYITE